MLMYGHLIELLYTVFGLVIGFTEHLKVKLSL
jgi:hypothetical protein